MFSFKTSSVVAFVVPLMVDIRYRFMTVLSETFNSGKESNRTDLIAYASYAYDRYVVKLTWGHAHKTRSWYLLGVTFQKIRRAPPGAIMMNMKLQASDEHLILYSSQWLRVIILIVLTLRNFTERYIVSFSWEYRVRMEC